MQLEPHIRFLAIEGVIGVGKTTLAEMLASDLEATLLQEEFAENPFLPKFYEDKEALRIMGRTHGTIRLILLTLPGALGSVW